MLLELDTSGRKGRFIQERPELDGCAWRHGNWIASGKVSSGASSSAAGAANSVMLTNTATANPS
jgi:hypothetical protein